MNKLPFAPAQLARLCSTLLALTCAGGAQAAQVTHTNCIGTLTRVVIPGDLWVTPGATCTLVHSTVKGDVRVAAQAQATFKNVQMNGEFSAENARFVKVTGSAVRGRLDVSGGGSVTLNDTRIGADVAVRGLSGQLGLTRLSIGGLLSCSENAHSPAGTWIKAQAQSGQCKDL
ncbi:hypothetical protein ACFP81_12475 [Deinococcus lacus]|uniref:DUF3060 domain-containing protein n=1 Tax=Deinococcus lacus TaxID=392561 RepID=A0ABW1YI07_9DEIO